MPAADAKIGTYIMRSETDRIGARPPRSQRWRKAGVIRWLGWIVHLSLGRDLIQSLE
jgi:hypothetical protein